MANPCETHRNFEGDLCPVCLLEEVYALRDALRAHQTAWLCRETRDVDGVGRYIAARRNAEKLTKVAMNMRGRGDG